MGLSFGAVALELALLGFFGGFFIVPISALLQHRPAREQKGGVLAAANLLSFVGILLASGRFLSADGHAETYRRRAIFLLIGGGDICAAPFMSSVLLPDSLLRFVLWCVTHSLYRIRVDGRDNIPEKGGALFVCNHVSWMDALLLIASTDRPVRFLMFKDIYEKPLDQVVRAHPRRHSRFHPNNGRANCIQSLQTASDAIRNGEVVCIFAEGQITRIGQLLPFRRGMERIMKDVDAPVIPVALDGVPGSLSSFEQGRFVWKWPREFRIR